MEGWEEEQIALRHDVQINGNPYLLSAILVLCLFMLVQILRIESELDTLNDQRDEEQQPAP